ncbi:hypothetical protein B5F53_18485 [Blautia sp. An249]|uniref:hypothetical protein n=1 Tax=Blautia sp. An249 TaxID=1965603 RepID=UPI000B3B0030|nr:hypothetical protein [Blautia sp. An249]OUO75178.1 hypothetical protein B5F53_18485 [Blautia sp. An249]
MFEKIKVSKEIIMLMCDKVCGFISDYYNNRINEKAETKRQLSTTQFERELRNDLQYLETKIDNVEAFVYQSRQLFENSIKSLSRQTDTIRIENMNFFGDIQVTINCNLGGIQINGDGNVVTKHFIQQIVNNEADELFEAEKSFLIDNSPVFENKKSIKEIISIGENKLKKLRGDD